MNPSGPLSDLAGKSVIVTGGAGGIGAAICAAFVDCGADVICADISATRGAATARDTGATFEKLDVSEPADWDRVVDGVMQKRGAVHALVHGAYSARGGNFDTLSAEAWRANFPVTLDGVFYGTKAVAAYMGAGASIVNVASVAAKVGMPVNAAYGAAKGAICAFSRAAAVTLAPRGIRVNTVLPGFIETRALDGLGALVSESNGGVAALQAINDEIPLGRFGDGGEIASVVRFLASNEAAYITGAEIVVDGGYCIRQGF